jgi:hypothetical protein
MERAAPHEICDWLSIEAIPLIPPFEAYLLRLPSGFPIVDEQVPVIRELWQKIADTALARWELSAEVFIQLARLRGATRRFEQYAGTWMPTYGLGVWPDREPPTLWTKADFESLNVGESPKPLMYKLMRVTTSPQARSHARFVMLGLGGVLEILIEPNADRYLKRTKDLLLPPIVERAFRIFPFYIPLIEKKSLLAAKADQLKEWFCGSFLYMRESPEDNGIVIASSQPLSPILEQFGGRFGHGQGQSIPI